MREAGDKIIIRQKDKEVSMESLYTNYKLMRERNIIIHSRGIELTEDKLYEISFSEDYERVYWGDTFNFTIVNIIPVKLSP